MAWPDNDPPAAQPIPGPRFRDLTVRTVAGIVLAALAATAVLLGPYGVVALTVVVLAGVAAEWRRLIGHGLPTTWAIGGGILLTLGGLCFIYIYFGPYFDNSDEMGRNTLFWFVAAVIANDTCAYGIGRWLGGPKLAPRISPKKTWSGSAGGLVGAAIVGALVAALVGAANVVLLAAVAVALALVAQAGDLAESAVKRRAGVKDAGAIIPGHGGMLDRFDGLAAAAIGLALAQAAIGDGALTWG